LDRLLGQLTVEFWEKRRVRRAPRSRHWPAITGGRPAWAFAG
jgi:hypothetical protein